MEGIKTTKDYLTKAIELVSGERAKEYGDKVSNHWNIANFWTMYLGMRVTAHDVAIMMTLLKIARTKLGDRTDDTYIDASAYMAIAGECEKKNKEQLEFNLKQKEEGK